MARFPQNKKERTYLSAEVQRIMNESLHHAERPQEVYHAPTCASMIFVRARVDIPLN